MADATAEPSKPIERWTLYLQIATLIGAVVGGVGVTIQFWVLGTPYF